MKTEYLLLAAGAAAFWWYSQQRKQQPLPSMPQGSPYYTPPAPPPVATVGPAPRGHGQSLSDTLKVQASQVLGAAAQKGASFLSDKASSLFSDLMSRWSS